MPAFYQMTGRGLANAAGQAAAMQGVRGRSAVVSQRLHHQDHCTLLHSVGLLERGTAQGKRESHQSDLCYCILLVKRPLL